MEFQIRTRDVVTKIKTTRNEPRYRGPTPSVVPSRMNPTAAITAKSAQNGPRIRNLSDSTDVAIIRIKHSKYGGAVTPFDWTSLNDPISETIVGKKSGSEAKLTLLQKFIKANK